MKAFTRIIPKQGHTEWMQKLGEIGGIRDTVNHLILGVNPDSSPELEELLSLPMEWSDYHGIGILNTPYFVVVMDTFPPLTEKVIVVRMGEEGCHEGLCRV